LTFKWAQPSLSKFSGGAVGIGLVGCWYLQSVGGDFAGSPAQRFAIDPVEGVEGHFRHGGNLGSSHPA